VTTPRIPGHAAARLAREALLEDLGPGDVTTEALIPATLRCAASITAGEPLVVSGLQIAEACFLAMDPAAHVASPSMEGDRVARSGLIMTVKGNARAILAAERSALNFLGRLSGIATLTRQCVDAAAGTRAAIVDTRKTTPGLRALEKQAVLAGGGRNHRFGLFDAILVKDNHRTLAPDLVAAIRGLRRIHGTRYTIGVEVEDLAALEAVLDEGVDLILLDNMTTELLREAVRRRDARSAAPRPMLEASGGITLATVAAVAACGVDRIAIGSLTHGARAMDVSLHVAPEPAA
jgi:nicotinate-nucleotide pyrophosphorylase (carboxylating)